MKILDKYLEKYIDKYFARKAIEEWRRKLACISCEKEVIETPNSYQLFIKGRAEKDKYKIMFTQSYFDDGIEEYLIARDLPNAAICKQAERKIEEMRVDGEQQV